MKHKMKIKRLYLLGALSIGLTTIMVNFFTQSESQTLIEDSKQFSESKTSTTTSIPRNTQTNHLVQETNYPHPENYYWYYPLAITDGSPAIITDYGYFGIWNDRQNAAHMISYSGYKMWGMKFYENPFIKDFCAKNNISLDSSNQSYVMRQWIYSREKDALILLLTKSNGADQIVVALDAKTGLMYNPKVDNELNVIKYPIVRINSLSLQSKFFELSDESILTYEVAYNWGKKQAQKIVFSDGTLVASDFNVSTDYSGRFDLMNIIKGKLNHNYVVLRDKNNNDIKVSVVDNDMNIIPGTSTVNISRYINNGTDVNNNSYINFQYVNKKSNNEEDIYFLSGNSTTRTFHKLTFSNNNLQEVDELNLAGFGINTITVDPYLNIVYIGNNASPIASIMGYIDLNKQTMRYESLLSTTSTTFDKYWIMPILENPKGHTRKQMFWYLKGDKNHENLPQVYIKNDTTNEFDLYPHKPILFGRKHTYFSDITKQNWFVEKMQKNISDSDLLKFVYLDSTIGSRFSLDLNPKATITNRKSDEQYGTFSYNLSISFSWFYDPTFTVQYDFPIYLNGFYKINADNYTFNWVTSTTVDSTKYMKIEELKKTKYAKDVTRKEVLDYFWTGSIKDKNGDPITITENMFTVDGNWGTLDKLNVTFILPSNLMPQGFPKLKQTNRFDGFLSIQGYETNPKTQSEISVFASTIYPSQLTKQMVIDNFINVGSNIKKDLSYWDFTISNIDDMNGIATISLKYKYEIDSSIPGIDSFPVSQFQVFNNYQISSFKSVGSKINDTPFMVNFEGNSLPSEIWNQYLSYKNGNSSSSILMDNISFSMVPKNSLEISLLNADTCDADEFLRLSIKIVLGTETNIEYDGNQLEKTQNNKLVFNQNVENFVINNNLDYYPYIIEWGIKTKDKYFKVFGPDGNQLKQENNVYSINLKDYSDNNNLLINDSMEVDDISLETISKLIDSSGYDIFVVYSEKNQERGYWKVQYNLIVKNDLSTIYSKRMNLKNDSSSQIKNSNRTIYIYNFKVPNPSFLIASYSVLIILGIIIVSSFGIWFSIWTRRKIRYNKLKIDPRDRKRKEMQLKHIERKYELTKKIIEIEKKK